MPSKIPEDTDGVLTTPLLTVKRFIPLPSETVPPSLSMIASSKPALTASCLASVELR